MQHTEYNWYGTDGKMVFAQTWHPEKEISLVLTGVVCLIHGLGEHSGRYEHVARFFTQHNFAVIACDLRGHGQSEGARGYVRSFDVLLDQVDKLLEESSKRFPGVPKFIYGHSMGGNIVISHALTHNPRVKGVIASAPWLRASVPVPAIKLLMARVANLVWGGYTEDNQLNTSALSHDPAVVEAYELDPLVHRRISARLFFSGVEYGKMCLAEAAKLRIPMLVMHGSGDTITDHEASREFVERAGRGVSLKIWEGLFHEIHNEPEHVNVLQHMLDWMQERLKSKR
jgi:alpha-beta hydrolase superfamily lysophospholipase